jgi:hypothetical protein
MKLTQTEPDRQRGRGNDPGTHRPQTRR